MVEEKHTCKIVKIFDGLIANYDSATSKKQEVYPPLFKCNAVDKQGNPICGKIFKLDSNEPEKLIEVEIKYKEKK